MKADNEVAEKQVHAIRTKNEKMARAIKRVKENPQLASHVARVNSVDEDLENQIHSAQL